MTKINSFFKLTLGAFAISLALVCCNKDLQDDVNNLKDRVTSLEESVDLIQEAIDNGMLITAVNAIPATATTPAGWELVFSNNETREIYNGEKGDQGIQGEKGDTPYIWINSAGNWASYNNSKPTDSNNPAYELKIDGQSVKANGVSVRVVDKNGYVAFEEYDAITGAIKNTVTTNFPFNGGKIITAIVETDEAITFTIDKKDYTLAKPEIYPMSITVIRDKDYVIKGGTVTFDIAVNPSTNKVYPKEAFSLDFEPGYNTRAYGLEPGFIKIKEVEPLTEESDYRGQYRMTLEWADQVASFAKDAPIFIVLNFTDAKGNSAHVISATPLIMNEEYVRIEQENLMSVNDIYMFTDETVTDSVRLSNYHEGYVNSVDFAITSRNGEPKAVNDPFNRYIASEHDKYKFTVIPIPGSNSTVWPEGVYTRVVDVKASVTDNGRPAVPVTPARPEIGQPELPGVPAIAPRTVTDDFTVTVYKVPADGVIYRHDFKEYWIPNKTEDYKPSVALSTQFSTNGYATSGWNFAIKSQTLKKDGSVVAMTNNITEDVSKFDAANNFAVAYKLLPTINEGTYTIELLVTATPKTPRPAGLSQSREFKVILTVKIVAPTFQIEIKDGHALIASGSDTYKTYKLANVNVADLIKVESTKNISKATDLTPNTQPLGYEFDMTDPRHGAQGVRFNPYPAVIAPAITDWYSLMSIKKPITIIVKLDTGQELPVRIICTQNAELHATKTIYVQYDRLNLHHVEAVTESFAGNYNTMISTGINIAASSNFTPHSSTHITLDPTMIKTPNGIVFSEVGTVQCKGGPLPSGLAGKKIMSINATTGLVKSIDGMTWENPDAVLFQTFRVTYTDIWGNSAYKNVDVYVKSNGIPTL